MAEFLQFLFVTSIVLDILCVGTIISIKPEDLKTDKKIMRIGKFVLITLIFTTAYIISYLL